MMTTTTDENTFGDITYKIIIKALVSRILEIRDTIRDQYI